MSKRENRKVIFISKSDYTKSLKTILNTVNGYGVKYNLLYVGKCEEDSSNLSYNNIHCDLFSYLSNNQTLNDKIYQFCILNDFESNFNVIPKFIERVQRGGLIIFISDEFSRKKSKIKYNLSTFSRRFIHHLKNKTDFSVLTNNEKASLSDLEAIDIIEECPLLFQNDDQTHAINAMISSKDTKRSSVTLLSGGSGRGKRNMISVGIANAIEKEIVDIFVIAPDQSILNQCSDNIQKNLKLMGQDMTDVHLRRPEHYFILEVVRNTITHKVRFLRFDQQFSKYDAGLLCVIEIGQLSTTRINKILSHNPTLVWATATTSGPLSIGNAVFDAIVRRLRSFCGVAESMKNNVDETTKKGGLIIREISNKTDEKKFINITLSSPIIYNENDSLEASINDIFCLKSKPDIKHDLTSTNNFYPAPSDCEFMYINKETLFSGHAAVELFLSRFMDVYTSFDHKRQSDFLQELVDNPKHHLFCLQQPSNVGKAVPQILTIVHVSIDEQTVTGHQGLKIVNLITNGTFQNLGYARRSLNSVYNFLSQSSTMTKQTHPMLAPVTRFTNVDLTDLDKMPRLLVNITDLPPLPTKIDHIWCRFLATNELLCFWKKCSYMVARIEPESANEVYCTVVRDCDVEDNVANGLYREMCDNIGDQYRTCLRDVDVTLLHEILFQKNKQYMPGMKDCDRQDLDSRFTKRDLSLLDSFVQNSHSFESVQPMIHHIAVLYFSRKMPGLNLAKYQELSLVGFGLQLKSPKQLATEMIVHEKSQNTGVVNPFNLHKDVQAQVITHMTSVRECVRVFLHHVTKIIETKNQEEPNEDEATPAKKMKLQ